MPTWKYSISGISPEKTAMGSGRDLRISPKAAREICAYIRGMKLSQAKQVLENVIEKKQLIPYKRHNKEIPHRRGVPKFYTGRYPQKAAKEILKVLGQVESNAEFKGLVVENVRITHLAAQRARKIKKYIPRAFGRSSPYFDLLTHIEVVVEEV